MAYDNSGGRRYAASAAPLGVLGVAISRRMPRSEHSVLLGLAALAFLAVGAICLAFYLKRTNWLEKYEKARMEQERIDEEQSLDR